MDVKHINELFQTELNVLSRSSNFLSNENIAESDYKNEYEKLLKSYKDLLRSTKSITKIGDRNQKKLLSANKTIQDQQSKLEKRNRFIEREIQLAKTIQKQHIPQKSPFEAVSFLYKPMDEVGGDFFDFTIDNENYSGFFLSDVSGHGVPAAFITAMLKSLLLQAKEFYYDPAGLLTFLNDSLYGHTGGNFVTAIYGVLNHKDQVFNYALAGHNLPYIIDTKDTYLIDKVKAGFPLAIASNSEHIERNKLYYNYSKKLKSGQKLLLYTDGFTEVANQNNRSEEYEEKQLKKVCNKFYHLESREFLENIYSDLLKFKGDDNFEDDICIICIDI